MEGDKPLAILLLIILFISGLAISLNLVKMIGIDLHIAFSDIHGFKTGFFVLLCKLVGIVLAGLSAFVIVNIIRD